MALVGYESDESTHEHVKRPRVVRLDYAKLPELEKTAPGSHEEDSDPSSEDDIAPVAESKESIPLAPGTLASLLPAPKKEAAAEPNQVQIDFESLGRPRERLICN
eukprot:g14058.t1